MGVNIKEAVCRAPGRIRVYPQPRPRQRLVALYTSPRSAGLETLDARILSDFEAFLYSRDMVFGSCKLLWRYDRSMIGYSEHVKKPFRSTMPA